jgi:hypothetical protein
VLCRFCFLPPFFFPVAVIAVADSGRLSSKSNGGGGGGRRGLESTVLCLSLCRGLREFEGEAVEEGADGGWHDFDLMRCVALRWVRSELHTGYLKNRIGGEEEEEEEEEYLWKLCEAIRII